MKNHHFSLKNQVRILGLARISRSGVREFVFVSGGYEKTHFAYPLRENKLSVPLKLGVLIFHIFQKIVLRDFA